MPRPSFNNNKSNTNASEVTRRAQGRAAFANFIESRQALNQGCTTVQATGANRNLDNSSLIEKNQGANYTTQNEINTYITSIPSCIPIPTVNYTLECDDTYPFRTLETSAPFTFNVSTLGTGIITFYYVDTNNIRIGSTYFLLTDTLSRQDVTPHPETASVQYSFRCTPVVLPVFIGEQGPLDPTTPYTFFNTSQQLYILRLTTTETMYDVEVDSGSPYTPDPPYFLIYYQSY